MNAVGSVEVPDLLRRNGVSTLPDHLRDRHDIRISGVSELDVGVFRIDRTDGPPWVARLFPAARPIVEVDGDAAMLRALARGGFPAERCATPEPVSVHDGQAVLMAGQVPETCSKMQDVSL
jgi:hypothetical protein